MAFHGFTVEKAEEMLDQGLAESMRAYAAELSLVKDQRAAAIIDRRAIHFASRPFFQRLEGQSRFLYPFDSAIGFDTTRRDMPQAFSRGGSFMYYALKRWDEDAVAHLDTYSYSIEESEPETREQLHAAGEDLVLLGGVALQVLETTDVAAELELLEERIIPRVDAQSLFRSGVGWALHESVIAEQAADNAAGMIDLQQAADHASEINWDELPWDS